MGTKVRLLCKSLCISALFFSQTAFAEEEEMVCCSPFRKISIEGGVGYFYPFSKTLREIVGGGADYRLTFSYKRDEHVGIFLSGDYFIKEGISTGSHSKTSLWILPVTLGLRFYRTYWFSCYEFSYYLAMGPRYYIARATNDAPGVDHHNFVGCIGAMGGIGFFLSYEHLSLHIFTDASYANGHSHTSIENVSTPNMQLGSLIAGGGIAYTF